MIQKVLRWRFFPPPQDLTLLGKQTALVPLSEMKTTLGGGRLGLTHDGCAVALKLRLLTLGKCRHILLYLVVGDFAVNLCRVDTTMPEHLAERLHRNAVGEAERRSKGMPCHVENTFHLRNWKNVENKPVTCCELVDFLYSASMIGKQSRTEY